MHVLMRAKINEASVTDETFRPLRGKTTLRQRLGLTG
jgi:hypothetical protein